MLQREFRLYSGFLLRSLCLDSVFFFFKFRVVLESALATGETAARAAAQILSVQLEMSLEGLQNDLRHLEGLQKTKVTNGMCLKIKGSPQKKSSGNGSFFLLANH